MADKSFDSEEQSGPEDGFSSNEAAEILSRYDIGTISSVRAYQRGSSRAPKALVESERGEFLLKRRANLSVLNVSPRTNTLGCDTLPPAPADQYNVLH